MTQASSSFAWPRPFARRRAYGALCALWVATLAHAGRADDAENVAAARSLGIQGVQLADAGKCPEAIEKLERAEALHHAPTILGRLGECQVTVGQVVEGTENLNRVVREALPSSAPKVFREAQDRAQKVLTAATPKIAHLVIRIIPADVPASVAVAGKSVPAALLGAERPTDPGTHLITAAAVGYQMATATVTLAEGGHEGDHAFTRKRSERRRDVNRGNDSALDWDRDSPRAGREKIPYRRLCRLWRGRGGARGRRHHGWPGAQQSLELHEQGMPHPE